MKRLISLLPILSLFLAPTYVVRFSLAGLPVNLYMLWVVAVWVLFVWWLWQERLFVDFRRFLRTQDPELKLFVGVFLLAGLLSFFIGGVSREKLGQLAVLFIQPITLFYIARYIFAQVPAAKQQFVRAALVFVGVAGAYAAIQYTTLWGLPSDWWGNSSEPKRALSFFSHPNGFALFMAPLLAFLFPYVHKQAKEINYNADWLYAMVAYITGLFGFLLSLSRGGWLGFLAAITIFVLKTYDRRFLLRAVVAVGILGIIFMSIPSFRYRVILPFMGEKSAVARFSLWDTGWRMVESNPIFGKGLLGFSNNWEAFNTDPGLAHYNAPHNVVLNFWVDTGIFGLISFLALCVYALLKSANKKATSHQIMVALAIVAILVHGLVDTPYLKNDLAALFWLLFAFF